MRLCLLLLLVAVPAVPAPGAWAQEQADSPDRMAGRLFVQGMTRAFLGDDETAVALYRQALRLTPDDPAIMAAMVQAHRRLGAFDTALFLARRVAQLQPASVDAGLVVADLLADSGRPAEAAAELDSLVSRHPDDAAAARALARMLERAEQPLRARDVYRDLAGRTGHLDDRLALLDLEIRLGDTGGALQTLDDLDRRLPADPTLLRRRAAVLVRADRADEAMAVVDRILTLIPGDPEALALRDALVADTPTALTGAGQTGADWLQRAESDPRNIDAWAWAIRLLASEGQGGVALRTADDALLLFPGNARLGVEAGIAALLQVLPERAARHFDDVLAFASERGDGDDDLRLTALAGRWLADRLLSPTVAMPAEIPATAQYEGLPPMARDLAAIAHALGGGAEDPALREDYGPEIDHHPVEIMARGLALWASGRETDALAVLEPASARDDASPLLLLATARVLDAVGRRSDAHALRSRALDASPDSSVLRGRVGG